MNRSSYWGRILLDERAVCFATRVDEDRVHEGIVAQSQAAGALVSRLTTADHCAPCLYHRTGGWRSVGSWFLLIVLGWTATSFGRPENPLTPDEEAFMRKAQTAYEADDLDSVERHLQHFRQLVGQRPIPNEVSLVAADLAFRAALAKLRAADWKQIPIHLTDAQFDPLWKSVETHTLALMSILGPSVQRHLDKGNKNYAMIEIARQQRLYLDRIALLKTLQRFVQALTELNEVDRLRELYEIIASEEILIEGSASPGHQRLKQKRGDVFGFYGRTAIQSDRILLLKGWRLQAPDDASIKDSLAEALTAFVEANPGHERSYNYVWDSLELSGKLAPEALQKSLDATSDKSSEQFVHNQIGLGNLLLEEKRWNEAMALYESALKSEKCPPDRLAEIYDQMADIHTAQGRIEKAIELYKLSKSLSDRFQATDAILAHLEKQVSPPPPRPVQPNRRLWLFGLWISHAIVAVVAILIWKRRHRSPDSPRSAP